jgi:hypothetical protein
MPDYIRIDSAASSTGNYVGKNHSGGRISTVASWSTSVTTSLWLFSLLLFDPFALATACMSIASVLFYFYVPEAYHHSELSYPVSWTVASFVVIFPVTFTIGQSFSRRERANNCLAQIKSLMVHIFVAHSIWDWDKSRNGRRNMPSVHAAGVKSILLQQAEILTDCLNLPPICPTRTQEGESYSFEKRDQFEDRVEERRVLLARMMKCARELGCCVELLKYHGLPANEVLVGGFCRHIHIHIHTAQFCRHGHIHS